MASLPEGSLTTLGGEGRPVATLRLKGARIDAARGSLGFDRFNSVVRGVWGREYDKRTKGWSIPATALGAWQAVESFAALGPVAACDGVAALVQAQSARQKFMAVPDAELPRIEGARTEPLPHQVRGSALIQNLDTVFLSWEMGTGKTKAVIDAIMLRKRCHRVLVVCPKSVAEHWRTDWRRHGDPRWHVLVLAGGKASSVAERSKTLQGALLTRPRLVVAVNYDAVWRKPLADVIVATQWDLVVADESQRIKDPKGRCSTFFAEALGAAPARVALSGTPIQSTPLDLFAQCRWLDKAIFGNSISAFKEAFCVEGDHHEVVAFRNQADMARRFGLVAHRVRSDDVLRLPEFEDVEIEVELSAKARKLYDDVQASLVAKAESGTVTVSNALVELLRLQQIASGAVRFDGEDEATVIDSAKEDALADLLDGLDKAEPLVVFCLFRFELAMVHRIAARLGRASAELSGKRDDLLAWQNASKPSDPSVIAVQIKSGGLGVQLQRARYNVFLSPGFSYGMIAQARGRSRRMGQNRVGTYYRIKARGTVDEVVDRVLKRKEKTADIIIDGASTRSDVEATLAEMLGRDVKLP